MLQRYIIIFTCILLVASSAMLGYRGQTLERAALTSGWWSAYFADPSGKSPDFIIENHGSKKTFSWSVIAGKTVLNEQSSEIRQNSSRTITPPDALPPGKISIRVSDGKEAKTIYYYR